LLGGCAIGAAGAILFAIGLHLSPETHTGRNLIASNIPGIISDSRSLPAGSSSSSFRISNSHLADNDTVGPLGSGFSEDPAPDSPGSTFQQIYLLLQRNYVDGVPDDTKLAHGAAAAMLTSLQDPDSRFMEPAEFTEQKSESQGKYSGLGAVLAVRKITHPADIKNQIPAYDENRLTIEAALPGSPAEKAGLKSGDVITEIDSRWLATYDPVIADAVALRAAQDDPVVFNKLAAKLQAQVDKAYSLTDAQTHLCDPDVKTMALTISRPGVAQPFQVTVDTVSPTQVTPISSHALDNGIGYIKISVITPDTDTAFETALTALGPNLKGLVLDLRNCPGGDVESASRIAGKLSNVRSIGLLRLKSKKQEPIAVVASAPVSCPIVVLVDGGTANAAELLASTLRQSGAKLVGSRTFGDDTAVRTIALKDGSGFTLTIGKLLTNAGIDLGGTGLQPDVQVNGTDDPINSAVAIFKQQPQAASGKNS
jgi:carboxyl-terminal processing protease